MKTVNMCLFAIMLGGIGLSLSTIATIDQAFAQPSDAGVDAAPLPSDALANPATDPVESISDLRAARKFGWPAAVFAAVTMLAMAVGTLGKNVKQLAWANKGKTAVVIGGAVALGCAGYNSIVEGGTPVAIVTAVLFAAATYYNANRPAPKVPA